MTVAPPPAGGPRVPPDLEGFGMTHVSLHRAAPDVGAPPDVGATADVRPTPVSTRAAVGSALICAAVVLIGWACWLGASLPVSGLPQSWSSSGAGLGSWRLTWVGLDALEVAGLLATGIALRRHHWSATVSALLTLPLFVLDAWFDIMTASTSTGLGQALTMALLVELPTASVLGWVARSGLRALRHGATPPTYERP